MTSFPPSPPGSKATTTTKDTVTHEQENFESRFGAEESVSPAAEARLWTQSCRKEDPDTLDSLERNFAA